MKKDEFKVNDWVVVLPEDSNYFNSKKGQAVCIYDISGPYFRLTNFKGSWSNSYEKIRKATPQEIAITTSKPINIDTYEIY